MTAVVLHLLICRLRPVERKRYGGIFADIIEMNLPLVGYSQHRRIILRKAYTFFFNQFMTSLTDNLHVFLVRENNESGAISRQTQFHNLADFGSPGTEGCRNLAFLILLVSQEIDVLPACCLQHTAVSIIHILGQNDIRFDAILREVLCLIRLVDDNDAFLAQLLYLRLYLGRQGICRLRNHQDAVVLVSRQLALRTVFEIPFQQGILVHRIIFVAMQGIAPVFQIEDIRRMSYAHRRFFHRNAYISHTFLFTSHTFCAKYARKHRNEFIRSKRTARNLFACKHGDVYHRSALLQIILTQGDIIHKTTCLRIPGIVALEEETDTIKCHSRLAVHPRIMGSYMEEEFVHAKRQIAVEHRLEHGWCLIPYTTNLGESLCLNDVLIINMCTAHSIEHVIGFIVSRRIEPVFSHWIVGILIMLQSIGREGWCDTLVRYFYILLMSQISKGLEELLVYQVIDGETDILQNLFVSGSRLHRNTCHNREVWDEVVTAACLELLGKLIAPVLTATLPGIDVQILHHIAVRTVQEQCIPGIEKFPDGCR